MFNFVWLTLYLTDFFTESLDSFSLLPLCEKLIFFLHFFSPNCCAIFQFKKPCHSLLTISMKLHYNSLIQYVEKPELARNPGRMAVPNSAVRMELAVVPDNTANQDHTEKPMLAVWPDLWGETRACCGARLCWEAGTGSEARPDDAVRHRCEDRACCDTRLHHEAGPYWKFSAYGVARHRSTAGVCSDARGLGGSAQ